MNISYQTSCRSDWPRGFCKLIPNPHSWVDSSPSSYLFTSSKVRILVRSTATKCGTVQIYSIFEIRAAQLRCRTEIAPKSTFARVVKSPIRFGFRAGVTVISPLIWASPFPKPWLVIFASTVTLTVTQIARVIWEGDAHITRVLGMGMPKTSEMLLFLWHRRNSYPV